MNIIVIPARLASTRLSNKLLLNESGKPLIQHTYESALESKEANEIIIATEDKEIQKACANFNGRCILTKKHDSGSSRVAEIANRFVKSRIIVNWQGDEPEVNHQDIDRAIQMMKNDPAIGITSLACPLSSNDLNNPSIVKVSINSNGYASHFSRRNIFRETDNIKQHVGIYIYKHTLLSELIKLRDCPLKNNNNLEQLKFLYWGHSIKIININYKPNGINIRADYDKFLKSFS